VEGMEEQHALINAIFCIVLLALIESLFFREVFSSYEKLTKRFERLIERLGIVRSTIIIALLTPPAILFYTDVIFLNILNIVFGPHEMLLQPIVEALYQAYPLFLPTLPVVALAELGLLIYPELLIAYYNVSRARKNLKNEEHKQGM
jgi:hypothetical protein